MNFSLNLFSCPVSMLQVLRLLLEEAEAGGIFGVALLFFPINSSIFSLLRVTDHSLRKPFGRQGKQIFAAAEPPRSRGSLCESSSQFR